jgi:hypothetical protein
MQDLIRDDQKFKEIKRLDRQMCLVWGTLHEPVDGTAFTMEELRANMRDSTTTLRRNAEANCSRECFQVVIVASPSHVLYPNMLLGQLRPGISKGRRMDDMATTAAFRFLDFNAALKFGQEFLTPHHASPSTWTAIEEQSESILCPRLGLRSLGRSRKHKQTPRLVSQRQFVAGGGLSWTLEFLEDAGEDKQLSTR